VSGRVTFSDFHLGGNAAAHGGALSLMFDEILGWLANSGGRPIARTAYLHIDYRNVTPLHTELVLEGRIDRQEGRKCFASGKLLDGDAVVVDVECLFVVLLPGQS
jgi:acyl-coenzyme A thioesterase PaaI-like protein